jgi:hypothetical protein
MSRIVNVLGSPCSGRTTLIIQLAKVIGKHKKVVCVFTDDIIPVIPQLDVSEDDYISMGTLLDLGFMAREDVLKALIPIEDNIAVMGYLSQENKYRYREYSQEDCYDLILQLKNIADVVLVDCSDLESELVKAFMVQGNTKDIVLYSNDIKSLTYYYSNHERIKGEYSKLKDAYHVLNLKESNGDLIDEYKRELEKVDTVIPFDKDIALKVGKGSDFKVKGKKKYQRAILDIEDYIIRDNILEEMEKEEVQKHFRRIEEDYEE